MKKYTDDEIRDAVVKGRSFNESHTLLTGGSSGSSYMWFKKRVANLGVDTSHYNPSWNASNAARRASESKPKVNWLVLDEYLTHRVKTHILVKGLINAGVDKVCSICGLTTWLEKPISLTVDHIDGNWRNNLVTNLRFLCPNCHTQTETYGYRGKPNSNTR